MQGLNLIFLYSLLRASKVRSYQAFLVGIYHESPRQGMQGLSVILLPSTLRSSPTVRALLASRL